jgi:hypothetical protein
MKLRNLHSLVVAALFVAISCSCADSQSEDSLRTRIIEYRHSHSCESKCKNPIVEVRWDNFVKVVRFDDGHPIEEHVGVQKLREFLKGMPLSAWPKGPQLWLRYSDHEVAFKDEDLEKVQAAKHQNMIAISKICTELELTPTKYDGSPLTSEE